MPITNTTALIKEKHGLDPRCRDCLLATYERLMEKYQVNHVVRQSFNLFYNETMSKRDLPGLPQIHRELNREFCKLTGVKDPFAEEKIKSNLITLKLYDELRTKVIKSQDPFNMALRFSIAGNIMDYGPTAVFDINQTIQHVLESDFAIYHAAELKMRLKNAKKVLYLGDNAGEIVFDKLFIEMIMHHHLTYAVRGAAALNDATMLDSAQVKMDMVADVISNGYDASSTILDKCSQDFLDVYHSADVIISKGQGNLEGLIDENDPRIFFLLMVKCEVFAELLGVKAGSFVVYNPLLSNS